MRVGRHVVFFVLLLVHIFPLYPNDFAADDAKFVHTLSAELQVVSISSSGASLADTMGSGHQRLHTYAQHRNRIESQCARAYNRAQALEKENKQIKFAQIEHKLPKGFQQSFKKRGLFERAFTRDIERSQYKEDFYLDLLEKCGEQFTHEQLVQHQYAQMYRWSQYCYRGFRDFIESFALYKEYIFELGEHFKTCSKCTNNVYACEQAAYDLITQRAAEICKRKEAAEQRARQLYAHNSHQRKLCMQEIFTQQISDLDVLALEWQENNPERAQAYNETIENPQKLSKREYAISQQAAESLSLHGFDPDDYRGLHGNPLQHELFRELVDGIELFAQLPQVRAQKPFDVMMRTATLETFADARQITVMGDCLGASKLIDFGESLLRYCSAVARGFASGVWKGIERTGTDIKHIACHPDQVVMALGLVAIQFGDLIYNYVPFDDVMSSTYDEQDCERITKNWAKQSNKVVNWWEKTPSHEKMHQVVEVPVGFFTNAILFGCCASFAHKLATAACAEALALVGEVSPTIASAGAVTSESAAACAVQRAKEEAVKAGSAPANALKEQLKEAASGRKTHPTNIKEYWYRTYEAVEKAMEFVRNDPKKIGHVLDRKHKPEELIRFCGSEESTIRAILEAASGRIPADGVFFKIPIKVGSFDLYLNGRVMNGVPRIGTCYPMDLL